MQDNDEERQDSERESKFTTTASRRNVLRVAGAIGVGSGIGLGTGVAGGRTATGGSTAKVDGPIASTSTAIPGVAPKTVSLQLAPGESTTVEKNVTTPEIPPLVDIFLLEDETSSFLDDIDELQAQAPAIWDAIAATGTDFTMGVGGFRDFDNEPWGFASTDEWVYRLVQDLTDVKADFQTGVNTLTAVGGGDLPEGYLEALHYIAETSHPAIDSNQDGDTTDTVDTPTGQQPTWRADATRVVLLATDDDCHESTDGGGAYPGDVTVSQALTALNDASIIVVGLTPNGAGEFSCVDQLASGTGGSVFATTASGEDIGDAILAGLSNLPAEVTPSGDCDDGLSVSFAPSEQTVTSGETATFEETISVDSDVEIDGNEDTLSCTVDWLVNGESAGEAFVQELTVEVCADVVVDLIADQDEVIGTVTVSEDGDDISITYSLVDDWFMTESHLHLATDCDDIPQTGSGNPQVGKFDHSRTYDPAVQEDTYVIDQTAAGVEDDDELCIAAHAAVFKDEDGDGVFDEEERDETAWGEGERFTERGNWAMHFEYEVCD